MLRKNFDSSGLASFTTPIGLQQFVNISVNEPYGRPSVFADQLWLDLHPFLSHRRPLQGIQFASQPAE